MGTPNEKLRLKKSKNYVVICLFFFALPLRWVITVCEHLSHRRCEHLVAVPGVSCRGQNRENRQGKDFGGVKGYLEGIRGDSSLTKIQGKTKKNQGKTKKNHRTTKNN